MSVSARNMKNFRINRQPIHQILLNSLVEMVKVMGGLFLEPGTHVKMPGVYSRGYLFITQVSPPDIAKKLCRAVLMLLKIKGVKFELLS